MLNQQVFPEFQVTQNRASLLPYFDNQMISTHAILYHRSTQRATG